MPLCLYFGHFGHLISPFISDGEIHLDTPFSRLLGKPPIMVEGTSYASRAAGTFLFFYFILFTILMIILCPLKMSKH